MDKSTFLNVLKASFLKYLETGPRSNEKLKILHGAIAEDIQNRIILSRGTGYTVSSLGYGAQKEEKINGRYVDKTVDITIKHGNKPIAGIAVKFIMSNYMQNSNNYFENMLGETANIRCKNIKYFQIFVIPDRVPYFDNNGNISKWETINEHNLKKYVILSHDNINEYMHTPDKTLVYIINIPGDERPQYSDKNGYIDYYTNKNFSLGLPSQVIKFGNAIIYNDYELFSEKIVHSVLSI